MANITDFGNILVRKRRVEEYFNIDYGYQSALRFFQGMESFDRLMSTFMFIYNFIKLYITRSFTHMHNDVRFVIDSLWSSCIVKWIGDILIVFATAWDSLLQGISSLYYIIYKRVLSMMLTTLLKLILISIKPVCTILFFVCKKLLVGFVELVIELTEYFVAPVLSIVLRIVRNRLRRAFKRKLTGIKECLGLETMVDWIWLIVFLVVLLSLIVRLIRRWKRSPGRSRNRRNNRRTNRRRVIRTKSELKTSRSYPAMSRWTFVGLKIDPDIYYRLYRPEVH